LTYSWSFGDGSAATGFSSARSASHAYAAPLHYTVILTVRDAQGLTSTFNRRQTVVYPATRARPTQSSTIVSDPARGRISVVNSDANTVASISSAAPFTKLWEQPVGKNPQTLALQRPGGDLWVANQDDATLSVLDGATGATKATISLPYASGPFGIAFNPAGAQAYVTLEATGQLLRIDPSTHAITGALDVGPRPRGVAVSAGGRRVFVTRFLSDDHSGEVREINAVTFAVTRTLFLPIDTATISTESDGPGLPNYLQSISITPDGRGAWVPVKKDNIHRGTGPTSDGVPWSFESRVRTMVGKLDLVRDVEDTSRRKDVNNADVANAVAFNTIGDFAFVSTQGTNRVEVYDALSHDDVASIYNTGLAPRGLVHTGTLLFVQNFLSRDVAVFDVATAGGSNSFPRLATVSVQDVEPLSPAVLQGKRIFNNAGDTRMSRDGYQSCASCHLNGDIDGRTWDFTQVGEGLRNTASLLGRGGVGRQGPVHWTGTFDEIQDFESDIRVAFGGAGFLSDADFALTQDPLGPAKAGRSADLDALAAYVTSLNAAPPSPYRNPDGTLTADALAGKALFESAAVGCARCHSGPEQTDSAVGVFHDVGTATVASGGRLGGPLPGFDTPTLLGVWATAPYLHDGSAPTLLDVIAARNPGDRHGATSALTPAQRAQLVAYLQQLDEHDSAALPLAIQVDAVSTGKAYDVHSAAVGATEYLDRAYSISSLSPALAAGRLIRTSNDDKGVSAGALLQFTVNKPVTVHVGLDKRATANPAWLTGWTASGEVWTTSDGAASPFKVFTKVFPTGRVTLGGNKQAPGAGMLSNYSVIVTDP
jgi:YVTN family beta-propeller protein